MRLTLLAIAAIAATGCAQVAPPTPYGATPTADQLAWQQKEYYMFAHFGPNTFTNVEWGDGSESPDVFNPSNLDCRQWAATAKAAGMKGIIITAKHHDGFCLWPSQFSEHTVAQSAWREGKGDVLRELSVACAAEGIEFGVYLSPWDRNHPLYGTPEYNESYAGALREVLTGYGPVFEEWLDGANGEGPNGKKQVYDWPLINGTIRESQPHAVIFSDIGPDIRWIGNERGIAGETNWARLDIEGFSPGLGAPAADTLNQGNIHGAAWVPGEVDVSIRPGWFYSPETDDKVKTLAELQSIWMTSVGRNANLLLNVPPDRTGRIHPADSVRLMEFRAWREGVFGENLASGAKVKASKTRGRDYAAANILAGVSGVGASGLYWAAPDDVLTATLDVTLPYEQEFNCLMLQEHIALGQRIAAWHAEYWDGAAGSGSGEWKELCRATTVGYKRIVEFPAVRTTKLRIVIDNALACPTLNGFALYYRGK